MERAHSAPTGRGSKYFKSEVSPALTPLVIDPVHPFPFLSNLSTSLVFRLRDVARDESMFARVKVPGNPETVGFAGGGSQARAKAAGSAVRGHSRQPAQPLQRHGNQPTSPWCGSRAMPRWKSTMIPRPTFAPWSRNRFASAATNRSCGWSLAPGPTRPSRKCCVHASSSPRSISTRCRRRWTTPRCSSFSVLPLPALRDHEWTPLWPASLPEGAGRNLCRHASRRLAGASSLRKL